MSRLHFTFCMPHHGTFLALLAFASLVTVLQPNTITHAIPVLTILVTDPDPDAVNNGLCSLVEAIDNANADAATWPDCPAGSGADTIELNAAVSPQYALTTVNNLVDGANGLPSITTAMTIEGNGATVSRDLLTAPPFRIFHVAATGDLTLNDVVVLEGHAAGSGWGDDGGGILNRGALVLTNSILSKHIADDRGGGILNLGSVYASTSVISGNDALFGGGIKNVDQGKVDLSHSTVKGNRALSGNGGGIHNHQSELTVLNSTIFDNNAINGGGVFIEGGMATFANSTVSSNGALTGNGGGIYNGDGASNVLLVNVTVANNSANLGGGVYNLANNPFSLSNTIVADSLLGDDCAGIITSLDYNLDSDNTCNLLMPRDLPAGTADLGPLQHNGGSTQTHALLFGSDALDSGDNAVCAAAPVNNIDQRGFPRPGNVTCDIGAYERQSVSSPLVFLPLVVNGYPVSGEPLVALIKDAVPELKSFRLAKLNTGELSAALDGGQPVALPFVPDGEGGNELSPPQTRRLRFERDDLLTPDFATYLASGPEKVVQAELPRPDIFRGVVNGGDETTAHLVLSAEEGWISGYVQAPDGWSFIEPVELLLRRAGVAPESYESTLAHFDHVAYNIADIVIKPPHEADLEGVSTAHYVDALPGIIERRGQDQWMGEGSPIPPAELSRDIRTGPVSNILVTVSLWADYEYTAEEAGITSGSPLGKVDVVPAYIQMINSLAGVRDNLQHVSPDLTLAIESLRFEINLKSQCLSEVLSSDLLPQSRDCPHTELDDADLVHVYSGKVESGRAYIRGLLGPPGCNLRYPQYICDLQDYSGEHANHGVSARLGTLAGQILHSTHEMGHNFGGTHGQGDSNWGFAADVLLAGAFDTSIPSAGYDDILCGHREGINISFWACGNYPRRYYDPMLADWVLSGGLRQFRPPYLKSIEAAGGANDRYLAGDFNGDGLSDVAIGHAAGGVVEWRVALQQAGSAYKLDQPMLWHSGLGQPGYDFFAADFDGDGYDDLGFTGPGNRFAISWSVARSTGAAFDLTPPGGLWSAAIGLQSDTLLVADFTGDGLADVATGHSLSPTQMSWRVAESNGAGFSGGPTYPEWHPDAGDSDDLFFAADFDGDGDGDLAYAHTVSPGQVQWWVAPAGKEQFTAPDLWANDIGNEGDRFLIMDINGDGRQDVVFGHPPAGSPDGPYAWYGYPSTGVSFDTVFHVLSKDVCIWSTPPDCGTGIMLSGYGYGFSGRAVPAFSWSNSQTILSVLDVFSAYPP